MIPFLLAAGFVLVAAWSCRSWAAEGASGRTMLSPYELHVKEGAPIIIVLTVRGQGERAWDFHLPDCKIVIDVDELNDEGRVAKRLVKNRAADLPDPYPRYVRSFARGEWRVCVNLYKWVWTLTEGRYRVTLRATLVNDTYDPIETLTTSTRVVVTEDRPTVLRKLRYLERETLRDGEAGTMSNILLYYSPAYTLPVTVRLIPEDVAGVDLTNMLGVALLKGYIADPLWVIGVIAQELELGEVPESRRARVLASLKEHIRVSRGDGDLARAVHERLGFWPEREDVRPEQRAPSVRITATRMGPPAEPRRRRPGPAAESAPKRIPTTLAKPVGQAHPIPQDQQPQVPHQAGLSAALAAEGFLFGLLLGLWIRRRRRS